LIGIASIGGVFTKRPKPKWSVIVQEVDNSNKIITIDLTQDLLDETIDVGQLIHQQSVERLVQLVGKSFPSSISGQLSSRNHSRSANQVFFIDGTRGAGKSTFLAAVSKALPGRILGKNKQPSLCALPVIDPTMIETGELNVFFSILFQIKKQVEECKKCSGSWDKTEPNYESWRKALQKLARGANLLNGHKTSNPMDDLLSLEEGLESARSGANLRESFHAFLKESATMLGGEGFIIAFDDVDTNFDSGWEVLELIRRYLQCPKLVVLITGDLQLYTHLVRRRQFKHLGDELHKHDTSRKKERQDMVDHLEQQYLLKLFPLENRVHLYPLSTLLKSETEFSYRVKFGDDDFEALRSYIDDIVRKGFLIKQEAQIEVFRNFILAQPVRSIVQILRQYHQSTEKIAPRKLAEALRGIFMGSLYKLDIDVDALSQERQGKLIEAVFDAVIRDGEYDTGIYLRPQPTEESVRNAYVALAAEVAVQCYQNPAHAIRYFLVALGSVALLQKQKPTTASLAFNGAYVGNYKKTMSIGREEDGLNWARYAAPILLSPYDEFSNGVGPGVVKFSRWKIGENKALYTYAHYLADEWRDGSKDANGQTYTDHLQKIALRVATHQVAVGEQIFEYAAIFNLLGAIERLFAINGNAITSDVLMKLCSKVTVTAPDWLANAVSEKDSQEIYYVGSEANYPESSNIEKALPAFNAWLAKAENLSKNVKPSALFLGKVWPRLYFSLTKVADYWKMNRRAQDDSKYGKWGGWLMHLNVLCLLNAFLVEESDHHYRVPITELSTLDRSNPVDSSDRFFLKLGQLRCAGSDVEMSLDDFDKYFPLTMVIMRCPLIAVFLVHKTTEQKYIPKFIRDLLSEIFHVQPVADRDKTADSATILKNLRAGLNLMDWILIGYQPEKVVPAQPGNGKLSKK
jgi:hypothetical protein